MEYRVAARLTLGCVVVCLVALLAAGTRASGVEPVPGPQDTPQTFNLADFGAVGDGVADDGPAVQAALEAVMQAGGGTLLVPAGRFAIVTPIFIPGTLAREKSIVIRGAENSTPVPPPTAGGDQLSRGLGLTSEFLPRTGAQVAFTFGGLRSLLIENIGFTGTPDVETDALITISVVNIPDVVVLHCEFYGLAALLPGGAIIQNWGGGLTVRQTVFLGCTANSGEYTPVIQNLTWESITVEDSIFIDYGQRPELYAKTGYGPPISWVNVGYAAPTTADSPRREVVLRNVFLDEGGWYGVTVWPARYQNPTTPIDLFYATGLYVNVSNFNTNGLYLSGARKVLVEDSIFTWSHRTDAALQIFDAQDAILDRVRTFDAATRLRAEAATSRLTVIDSTYTDLASAAAQTIVLTPATPDEDPVRYVRAQFESALGRTPDAAAHYYWSRLLLDCGADATCVTSQRAALAAYLAKKPAATFVITGRATDENGQPLAGVAVTLAGSQSAATSTRADGSYSFARLPTSGVYTVTVGAKRHYTFTTPTRTVVTPAGAQVLDFPARLNRHAIAGRLLDERGRAIQGATLTLSGAQAATTTTDAQGNYSFNNLPAGGNYTVTASSARYSFESPSRSFADLDANVTADFTGASLFFNIAVQVLDSANKPFAGHTLALSGGKTATAATDAQGNALFADVPGGGSYTVTPAKLLGSIFTPASKTFDNLAADQTVAFVAVPTNFKIGGRVTSGGNGLAGVTVTLTGSKAGTTTTDSNGAYSFSVPVNGDYAVAPSKTHYTFDRASASFKGVVADQTADFVATLDRHKIGGRVLDKNNAGLGSVTLTLSGAQAATITTDAQGNYSFNNLPAGGNYTVAASKPNYSFGPANVTFNDLGADSTANFTGTLLDYAVRGRVTSGGAPLAGVVVTLSGSKSGTATTNSTGDYSFSVPAGGSYTVTPALKHYTFAPASASFADLGGDKTADFVATLNRHTLSGRVADQNGAGMQGVTVTLSGSQSGTATTDAQGNYAFPNLPAGGSYTLKAARTNYAFAPVSLVVSDLGADSASNNFTGTLLTSTLAGRVTEKGAALAGVTLDLAGTHPALGAQAARTTTAADGSYTFTVPVGGDYTVTPSKKNYAFAPAAATFKALSSDRTADFAATLQTVISFASAGYAVAEGGGFVTVTVTREGDLDSETSAVYEGHGGTAKLGSDFVASIGLIHFAPGETSKSFTLFITDDGFAEGPELFTLTLVPSGGAVTGAAPVASVTINDNDATPTTVNPVDDDEFFVRQHYRDFFSREPDAPGLKFWTDEIKKCGTNAQCREARRVSVSAAFFLSIEFKETGFLVYRLYRATYGRVPARIGEFMLDSRMVGDGVVVGAEGWPERLAANRKAFLEDWTQRPEFKAQFDNLNDFWFLQTLFVNMNVTPTEARRQELLAKLGAGATRAEVLAEVIEDEQFGRQEFNRAFVLMQYFGYLRRNPSDPPDADLTGYNHWLGKLEEFGGDYERAELVKAFLSSTEYRGRFGN